MFPNGLKLDLPKDKDIVKVFSTSDRGFTQSSAWVK
jgi:hypothetical protein